MFEIPSLNSHGGKEVSSKTKKRGKIEVGEREGGK